MEILDKERIKQEFEKMFKEFEQKDISTFMLMTMDVDGKILATNLGMGNDLIYLLNLNYDQIVKKSIELSDLN